MKARRLVCFVVMAVVIGLTGFVSQSDARVSVEIGINLPAYTFAAPPPLVVIPGTYAYAPPEADIDIVFYGGYWYRPYEGRWFRSRGYNGPWGTIAPSRVPRVLIDIPPDYRHRYRDHPRIEYRDFNKHWRGWERNRHWEKNDRWREGRGRDRHDDRRDRGRDHRGR